jgi:hypothetical protein
MNDRTLHPVVSRPLQSRFLTIPQTPLCYWLRERFFELLAGRTLADVADVCQGLATADDGRFVRFVWEAPPPEWARPVRGRRWTPFEKGGGYGRWFGHQHWVVDWQHDGARIKSFPRAFVRNEERYFTRGWTYSLIAQGAMGVRYQDSPGVIGHKGPGIYVGNAAIVAALNSFPFSFLVRATSPNLAFEIDSVVRAPIPDEPPALEQAVGVLVTLKRRLAASDPTERAFATIRPRAAALAEAFNRASQEEDCVAALLHALEGISEKQVFAAYRIDGENVRAVFEETGTPAGWFPLVAGHDAVPSAPTGVDFPATLFDPLRAEARVTLSEPQFADLKRRLRALYEAGPGSTTTDDDAVPENEDDEEPESATSGARIPIPAETIVEELSRKAELHPTSVYWVLRELREKDGAVCRAELKRFVEDYVGVLVLRLLGHRWPREVEAGEPPPAWVDEDGVIALTDGTGEARLFAGIRDRVAEDFGSERVGAIEREFEEIVGRPLGAWLASEFFRRHTSQFRKRPLALQIVSSGGNNEKRRGRGAGRNTPAFSCLVYYHRLDADLLPKLRTQYVGPLRTSLQTEVGSLERLKERSADQDARRLELEVKLEEIKTFDARLDQVISEGFASSAVDRVAANEPMDKWTSRDGRARPPASREALLAQERRYDPDLNDGVRVNIAPFQRAGLLPADVLAAKDVEKAIADRAAWRADERRWCREGKLPRPGWWPVENGES